MDIKEYTGLINEIAARAFQVFLYCWGEPLLAKNIAEYVRIARSAGLSVTLSSNLSFSLSDQTIESLILAGTNRLIVSLDGIDEQTYVQYRVGGDFNRVVENVRRFAQTKARLKKSTPKLIWQFLAFAHNENQIETAQKLYGEWGFDGFEIEKPNLPFGINDPALARQWFTQNPDLRLAEKWDIKDNVGLFCFWPWRSAVIHPDGGLAPCCYVSDEKFDAGNVFAQGFAGAWNCSVMQSLRNTILRKEKALPCANCSATTTNQNLNQS